MQDVIFPDEILRLIGMTTVACARLSQALNLIVETSQAHPDSVLMYKTLPLRDKIGALRGEAAREQRLLDILQQADALVHEAELVVETLATPGRLHLTACW